MTDSGGDDAMSDGAIGFALFDTAIGRCGLAWRGRQVAGLQLPERREDATRARLLARVPGAREGSPPPEVQEAVDGVVAALEGRPADLSAIPLDMRGVPAFHQRVYDVARSIPPGRTLTYGEIAARVGMPGSARAVGQALGRNPFAVIVPCHRVLAAGGKAGGFSASGGVATKLRMLAIEGARTNGQLALFDGDGALGFDPTAAVGALRASDPGLARAIDSVGPFRLELKRAPSLFGALAEAIVHQQLTGRVAETIFARVCALFPRAHEGLRAEHVARCPDDKLRAAGLSRAKMLALRDLARKAMDGAIPTLAEAHGLDDASLVERLTHVRGIGRWTVEMLLIFRLGRPDVLPADDYGVRKGFAIAFKRRGLPAPKEIHARGARWAPYRTVASWYLWRVAERAASAGVARRRTDAVRR